MSSLDDFLKAHPEIQQSPATGPVLPTDQTSITVTALLLEVNDEQVVFAHFGKCFLVARTDVQDVSATSAAIPNPFGKGMPATLTLRANAEIVAQEILPADSLLRGLPFAVARPSLSNVGRRSRPHTRQERSFFAARNIALPDSFVGGISTSFATITTCYDEDGFPFSDDSAWDSVEDNPAY
jgi:hypothetical protein